MHANAGSGYRVVYLNSAKHRLRELAEAMRQRGHGDALFSDVLELDKRLHSDPDALGEPFYRLKRAGLQVRTGNVRQLFALYAVDARRRIVYVRDFLVFGET